MSVDSLSRTVNVSSYTSDLDRSLSPNNAVGQKKGVKFSGLKPEHMAQVPKTGSLISRTATGVENQWRTTPSDFESDNKSVQGDESSIVAVRKFHNDRKSATSESDSSTTTPNSSPDTSPDSSPTLGKKEVARTGEQYEHQKIRRKNKMQSVPLPLTPIEKLCKSESQKSQLKPISESKFTSSKPISRKKVEEKMQRVRDVELEYAQKLDEFKKEEQHYDSELDATKKVFGTKRTGLKRAKEHKEFVTKQAQLYSDLKGALSEWLVAAKYEATLAKGISEGAVIKLDAAKAKLDSLEMERSKFKSKIDSKLKKWKEWVSKNIKNPEQKGSASLASREGTPKAERSKVAQAPDANEFHAQSQQDGVYDLLDPKPTMVKLKPSKEAGVMASRIVIDSTKYESIPGQSDQVAIGNQMYESIPAQRETAVAPPHNDVVDNPDNQHMYTDPNSSIVTDALKPRVEFKEEGLPFPEEEHIYDAVENLKEETDLYTQMDDPLVLAAKLKAEEKNNVSQRRKVQVDPVMLMTPDNVELMYQQDNAQKNTAESEAYVTSEQLTETSREPKPTDDIGQHVLFSQATGRPLHERLGDSTQASSDEPTKPVIYANIRPPLPSKDFEMSLEYDRLAPLPASNPIGTTEVSEVSGTSEIEKEKPLPTAKKPELSSLQPAAVKRVISDESKGIHEGAIVLSAPITPDSELATVGEKAAVESIIDPATSEDSEVTSKLLDAIKNKEAENIKNLMRPKVKELDLEGVSDWLKVEDTPDVDLSKAVEGLKEFDERKNNDLKTATALFEHGGFHGIKTPERADEVFGELNASDSPLENALKKDNGVIAKHLVGLEANARKTTPLRITIKRGLTRFFSKLFNFVFKQKTPILANDPFSIDGVYQVNYAELNKKDKQEKSPLQLLIEQDKKQAILDILRTEDFDVEKLTDRNALYDLAQGKNGWEGVASILKA
ncbi:hypothetical protein JQC92_05410 [Shewanella sp. 202IG2-18]|uniref:hypothetical protein n=1 Tax=Parashewanella hymeniacidonis TaxID=2807618 RepID=UPI001961107B|nr:hypothetical protein [Parashewanella hymeniacidonis]MBM7071475.1 hypothetical protein [Parashewanella hymeniacidonis]